MSNIIAAGIDWAAEDKNRAIAVISDDGRGRRVLEVIRSPVSDAAVVEYCQNTNISFIGIDTPFGWPTRFSDFVTSWLPASPNATDIPQTKDFRYRTTDRVIEERLRKSPLSVSTNLIGISARAWARIVQENHLWSQVDLTGGETAARPTLVEVYPGATMLAFFPRKEEIRSDGYKSDAEIRRTIIDEMIRRFNISVSESQKNTLISNGRDSDKIDAFVAALTALVRANRISGWTFFPPDQRSDAIIRREGWIFFPIKVEENGNALNGERTQDSSSELA